MSKAGGLGDFNPRFTALLDAPSSFSGKGGQGVRVNSGATGLEFGMQQPRAYRTPAGAEALGSILCTDGSLNVYYTVYYLQLGPLKAGDIVDADFNIEIKNDLSYGAELVTVMLLSNVNSIPIEYDVDPGGTSQVVCNFSGHNIIATGNHYYDNAKGGKLVVPFDYSNPWLHVRARARSSLADNSGYLTVMPGLGHVSAIVFPKDGK